MNKIAVAIAFLFLAPGAYAQGRKSLKDIDRELKQTKSTATAMALITAIGETEPQTDEDVRIMGELMDKYPVEGQKAAMRIKDPKLTDAVMKECDREVSRIKNVRAKGKAALTEKDRQDYLNGYMNGTTLIGVLAVLKNTRAIPLLREYLDNEDLSRASSIALGKLGDTASLEAMLNGMGRGAPIDLSGYGDKGLVRVLEELDKPGLDGKRKIALVEQIKGSSSPERKRMLKDLALKHKDPSVRDRSALALLNSMIVNQEPGDQVFISEWVGRTKNDETGYWAVTSIRTTHNTTTKPLEPGMSALLIDVLRTSTREATRQEAAHTLGLFRVRESAPYLKECIEKDKEAVVRTECRDAYWKISGTIPIMFHPDDVIKLAAQYADSELTKSYTNLPESDPIKRKYFAVMEAFSKYKDNVATKMGTHK